MQLGRKKLGIALDYKLGFPIWNCLELLQARKAAYCNSMHSPLCLVSGQFFVFSYLRLHIMEPANPRFLRQAESPTPVSDFPYNPNFALRHGSDTLDSQANP